MSELEIKKELHEWIDHADENLLKVIYGIVQEADEDASFAISDDHKRLLNKRLKAYYENPNDVLTWEDVKAKYGKA